MKNAAFCLVLAALFAAGCSSTQVKKAPSQGVEIVEAEGMGVMADGLAQARQNSINDAQKRAIESVVGVYISAESLVSKAKLVEENITSQTEGLIEDYKILKESRDNDFYKTTIRAWVRKEDLRKKLSEMDLNPKKYGNPSMSFWVDEKIDNELGGTNYVELDLMKVFVDAGFKTSDVKPEAYYKNPGALLQDQVPGLARLKSDIVILGDASSNFNTDQGLGGLISYRGMVSLKIMMTATREIITTISETASGIDVTREAAAKKAIENGLNKRINDLPTTVLNYLKERAYPTLSVSNVESMVQMQHMIRSVRSFPQVRDCWVISYADRFAVVALDLKRGTLEDVAKMLELNDNWKLKTLSTGKYNVEIEIISWKKL